jgi:hypothetical protein
MAYAGEAMSDHQSIVREDRLALGPEDALAEHQRAVTCLAQELSIPHHG